LRFFRLIPVLGLFSILFLSHASVVAEQRDAETERNVELQRALAVLDTTRDITERLRALSTLDHNAVCTAMLGANGEVITSWPQNERSPERVSFMLLVVPYDKGYRLIALGYTRTPLGLEVGDTYANIAPDGTFALAVSTELRRSLPLSPERWLKGADNTNLLIPNGMVVIARPHGSAERTQPRPPGGSIGWCLLEWDGHLIAPTSDVERPENFLWVLKTSDGIQFVHSGPLRTGVYATISADRRVTYGIGASEKLRLQEEPDWWPYVKDGVIKPIPEGRIGIPGPHYQYAAWDGDILVGLTGSPPID